MARAPTHPPPPNLLPQPPAPLPRLEELLALEKGFLELLGLPEALSAVDRSREALESRMVPGRGVARLVQVHEGGHAALNEPFVILPGKLVVVAYPHWHQATSVGALGHLVLVDQRGGEVPVEIVVRLLRSNVRHVEVVAYQGCWWVPGAPGVQPLPGCILLSSGDMPEKLGSHVKLADGLSAHMVALVLGMVALKGLCGD